MKIDLILNNVAQDRIIGNDEVAFSGWLHGPGAGTGSGNDLLPKFSFRPESFGAVFVFGSTQQVFIIDEEAFELLKKVRDGADAATLTEDKDFLEKLEKFGLI